jgi:hypothetical protein
MKSLRIALMLATVLTLSGCLTTQSYIDPKLHDLSWTVVKAPAQKHAVALSTEFYRNGQRMARADKQAQGAVERALDHSGVFARSVAAPATMKVKIDNLANMAEAMKKGFGTGLTFGAAGSTVTDGYEITIDYTENGQTVTKTYQHAIHNTIGNAPPVTSATPMAPVQAFDQVVEDAIMHFVRDMQNEGKLARRGDLRQPLQG